MAAGHSRMMVRRRATTIAACLAIGVIALERAPAREALPESTAQAQETPPRDAVPERIVSLVPALTEILFAIGAGPRVVGVSSYDTFPPEATYLPRVGALLDPDTERILALRPDLVISYGSQADVEARFARAGIRVFSYRHGSGISAVFDTIAELGAIAGRPAAAAALVRGLRAQLAAVASRVEGRRRPRTLLVLERQPNVLRGIYASGGIGFLHEILEAAGGRNVFAQVASEAVQPSHETLLSEAPEVVIEIRAAAEPSAATARELRVAWSQLASLPAVRNDRLHLLAGQHLVVPGPRLGDAAETIARALHPEAFR